jgi:SAM-dependent methyltransferase
MPPCHDLGAKADRDERESDGMIPRGHPFNRSGMAAVADLASPEWGPLFRKLETIQNEFLDQEPRFRSPEYLWPRDPLHNWSRAWEYPYTYHHLDNWRATFDGTKRPKVLDLGSGVTFFPFAVARLGCDVVCADIDPVCETDLKRAVELVPARPGGVAFQLLRGSTLPFGDAAFDALYCVSVLEHIPDFAATVAEMARVLKPQGLLVLTIDIDLRGDQALGVAPHAILMAALDRWFEYRFPDLTVHPAGLLDSSRGPFAFPAPGAMPRLRHLLKQRLFMRMLGRKPKPLLPFQLTVQGLALTRRVPAASTPPTGAPAAPARS